MYFPLTAVDGAADKNTGPTKTSPARPYSGSRRIAPPPNHNPVPPSLQGARRPLHLFPVKDRGEDRYDDDDNNEDYDGGPVTLRCSSPLKEERDYAESDALSPYNLAVIKEGSEEGGGGRKRRQGLLPSTTSGPHPPPSMPRRGPNGLSLGGIVRGGGWRKTGGWTPYLSGIAHRDEPHTRPRQGCRREDEG